MSDINLAQALDLSKLAEQAKKDAQEEAEIKAIVGDATEVEKAAQLPQPSGWHILCAIPEIKKEVETESGFKLLKAEETMRTEEILTTVLFVVALGPDCYTDKTRYPTGPWCKEGDFILVRPNSGSRLIIHGREFRMINEDTVEATVADPRGIKRK
jgi:co-chaperonin GroES (HSP10)